MRIPRNNDNLEKLLQPNKVLTIFGPRRVGKTTLLSNFLRTTAMKYKLDSGDNIRIQEILGSQSFERIFEYCQGYDLIAIDEAQRIRNIGMGLKIIVDNIPDIRVVVTGSSSFELAGQIGEPLVGRKRTLLMYPIAISELAKIKNDYELTESLGEYLIYGMYPDVLLAGNNAEKAGILTETVNSYLFKDILELERIKGSKVLLDLLRLLAFQVGSEVSLTELGTKLALDYKTVGRYIDLLEKSFILFNLRGYSRNLREEVTKKSKYYFYDNGILNAVISNFNSPDIRNDVGILWENFLVAERVKQIAYKPIYTNTYFWRTWEGKEIDWIEEREGRLFGTEFKYSDDRSKHASHFQTIYPTSEVKVINQSNWLEFVK